MSTFIGTITQLDRLTNTRDGGARWRVHLRGGTVLDTNPDSQVASMIGNFGPDATDGNRPVRITTNAKGFVTGCELAPEEEGAEVAESGYQRGEVHAAIKTATRPTMGGAVYSGGEEHHGRI